MELLERETHLDLLADHLRHASAGRGRMVLVGAEAGGGKSALVEAFCARIGNRDAVLRTNCDALSTPGPLGSVRDLAPALGLRLDPPTGSGEARDQLFRDVLATLAARPGPTVVIAEDAHWADGASLELFRFLGRRIGDLPILIVATYRDDEIGTDHPLRLVLGDLATASTVHRISIPPLSQAAVERMAAGSGRDSVTLHRLTGGNPFFVTEVLAAGDESVPATVGDAVLARAARLSPEARAVLDLAAVIGGTIDLDLLLTVAGTVVDEADECVARGLLRDTDDGLAFRHELVRDAILEAITLPRRRLLHARVLVALREDPQAGQDLARLAHHAEAAGDRAAVLTYAIAAAEQAAALHAHREAAAQYARALRFADALPLLERARLYEQRAIACYLSDQGAEATRAGELALVAWRELGNRPKEGESLRWLSRFHWFQGQDMEAEAAAVSAIALLETLTPGPELAMAYSTLSQLRMLANDLEEALLWGNRAISLAEQLGETETLVHALTNVGTARILFENPAGEDEIERGLRLALEHGFVDHASRAYVCLGYSAQEIMRLDVSERWLEEGIVYTTEHDVDFYRWYLMATHAMLRFHRGDWQAAVTTTRYLLRQPLLSAVTRVLAMATLGHVSVRRGSPEAGAILSEGLELAERTGEFQRIGPVRSARAEAALLSGDNERARDEVLAIQELILERGNRWQRGEFALLLWRAGDREIRFHDLAEPYALQIGGDFVAAAEAWRNLGYPYEEAVALAESADPALIRQAVAGFDELGAIPARDLAVRRLRSLGVRDIPARRRGPQAATRANPAGLTRREAEVLALVAAGLRNAEIAERLYLTPKTVRHHLTSVYAKLGVETRVEAARMASQLGIDVP